MCKGAHNCGLPARVMLCRGVTLCAGDQDLILTAFRCMCANSDAAALDAPRDCRELSGWHNGSCLGCLDGQPLGSCGSPTTMHQRRDGSLRLCGTTTTNDHRICSLVQMRLLVGFQLHFELLRYRKQRAVCCPGCAEWKRSRTTLLVSHVFLP